MKPNVGKMDKAIRLLIAVVIISGIFTQKIQGIWILLSGIVALALILTSFVSFCPIWKALHVSTYKEKTKQLRQEDQVSDKILEGIDFEEI